MWHFALLMCGCRLTTKCDPPQYAKLTASTRVLHLRCIPGGNTISKKLIRGRGDERNGYLPERLHSRLRASPCCFIRAFLDLLRKYLFVSRCPHPIFLCS